MFLFFYSFVYDKPVIGEATVVFALLADGHQEPCPFRLKKEVSTDGLFYIVAPHVTN